MNVCQNQQETSREEKIAQYREALRQRTVTADDLLIGSWVSFYSFKKDPFAYQTKQLADAGLNFNIFPGGFPGTDPKTMPDWETVEAEYSADNMVYFMMGGLEDEEYRDGIRLADGKAHCIGYHLMDEPGGDLLPKVGEVMRRFRGADDKRYPFVNLLPSYAGEKWLGGSYREYVQRFVDAAGRENIGWLSHDFYVFLENADSLGVFADMEVVRSVAYENCKLKTHAFPQSTKWTGMRMPNSDEMRWNVYAYLAYGFKALSWFNVVCPGQSDEDGEGFSRSLIYRDGTIMDKQLWHDFTALNWEVRGIGHVLMGLDTVHAWHTDGSLTGVEILPADCFIRPDGDADLVISFMEAKDGTQPYMMLFNKSHKETVTQSFTLDAASGITAVEYLDPMTGEYNQEDIADGHLRVSFRPGEGKLFRLQGLN
ncbi:MAG: hypothetical protein MJ175_06230 [Clostridia bacterium]|nr:hypothetical protein [Clostridia bacterium]